MESIKDIPPHVIFLTTPGIGRRLLRLKSGASIYQEGDVADAMFYIQSGTVKVEIFSDHGRVIVLYQAGHNEFFGEEVLSSGTARRLESAVVDTDCVLTRIERPQIVLALKEQPELAIKYIIGLLRRFAQVKTSLRDELLGSVEIKLARQFLRMVEQHRAVGPTPLIPFVSQDDLAEITGSTRLQINRVMQRFRKIGLIKYESRKKSSITVNVEKLRHLFQERRNHSPLSSDKPRTNLKRRTTDN